MPSRTAIALIMAFWLGTLGIAFYRNVWPRLTASRPPALTIDLAEEASSNLSVKWTIFQGERTIGRLTTQLTYADADDTFLLIHHYHHLEFPFSNAVVLVPQMSMTTRVNRAGDLREQTMDGRLQVQTSTGNFEAEVRLQGIVTQGTFTGHCEIKSPLGDFDQSLEPLAVPSGQALNPLMVRNRINGLQGGQSWRVEAIDPLGDAVAALVNSKIKQFGFSLAPSRREPLLARVSATPQPLRWNEAEHDCWVIEYRSNEVKARTWVRARDGKVLRRDAFNMGESLTIERND